MEDFRFKILLDNSFNLFYRNKGNEDLQNEAQLIIKEVQVSSSAEDNLHILKQLNKKHLLVVLTVILMTNISGMNLLTTYLVDIFSSTGIQEFTLVLTTGLAEMVFSFIQMIIADKLGR